MLHTEASKLFGVIGSSVLHAVVAEKEAQGPGGEIWTLKDCTISSAQRDRSRFSVEKLPVQSLPLLTLTCQLHWKLSNKSYSIKPLKSQFCLKDLKLVNNIYALIDISVVCPANRDDAKLSYLSLWVWFKTCVTVKQIFPWSNGRRSSCHALMALSDARFLLTSYMGYDSAVFLLLQWMPCFP